MKLVKPAKLQAGDKIAVVTLSAGLPCAFPHKYEAGKRQLEQAFGVDVVEMPHTMASKDFIAKNPQARADDLNAAFADPTIKGIISAIGGDDSVRILPYVDLKIIAKNPKVFMGYSDTTVSHFACMKAGLSSFCGPAIMAGFAENGGLFEYMEASVRKTLFSSDKIGEIKSNTSGWTAKQLPWSDAGNQETNRKLTPGGEGFHYLQGSKEVKGHLIGGCLEVLEFLKGTPFWPEAEQWEGAILFLETSEDGPSPMQVKWWLRNYAAQGILHKASGLIFGRPGGENLDPQNFAAYDQAILDVVRDECGLGEMPIVTNMDFGHTDPMFVIPYGAQAVIKPSERKFIIDDSGTL